MCVCVYGNGEVSFRRGTDGHGMAGLLYVVLSTLLVTPRCMCVTLNLASWVVPLGALRASSFFFFTYIKYKYFTFLPIFIKFQESFFT